MIKVDLDGEHVPQEAKAYLQYLVKDCGYLFATQTGPNTWVGVNRLLFHDGLAGGSIGAIGAEWQICYPGRYAVFAFGVYIATQGREIDPDYTKIRYGKPLSPCQFSQRKMVQELVAHGAS